MRRTLSRCLSATRVAAGLVIGALAVIGDTLRRYLKPDIVSIVIALAVLAAFVPTIPRATDNARALNCCINDEAPLTQIVDGMNQTPYGDPSNFLLAGTNGKFLPERWKDFNYADGFITYYGGLYLAVGYTILEPLRLLGVDTFPAAPAILRGLSVFFALLAVLLTYGFGREHIGRTAGALAALILATDGYFTHYALIVHPDTMQFALGMIALCVAVRHVELNRRESLVALGLLAGLVQGAKMGGPWLVPMVACAVAVPILRERTGAYADGVPARLRAILAGGLIVAGTAIAAYIVTTPYLILSRDFFKATLTIMRIVKRSSITSIGIQDWARDFWTSFGAPLMALAAVGAVLLCVKAVRRQRVLPLVLAVILGLSQFLFYAWNGRLWVELGYLLNTFVALGLLFGLTIQSLFALISRIPVAGSLATAALTIAVFAATLFGRWGSGFDLLMQYRLSRTTTLFEIGDWAAANGIRRDARIIWDSVSYFDPAQFPNARFYGGVLTYTQLARSKPDYIVLSDAIFGARHYAQLIQTQTFTRQNEGPHSMRLYQDLLATKAYGPTRVPGIEYFRRFAADEAPTLCPPGRAVNPPPEAVIPLSWRAALTKGVLAVAGDGPMGQWLAERIATRSALIDHTFRQIDAVRGRICLTGGSELRLYRIHTPGTPAGFEQPFASSSNGLRTSLDAFDGDARTIWRPAREDGEAPYLGFDYGSGGARRISRVQIDWEDESRVARRIEVEASDDGAAWLPVAQFEVAAAITSATAISAHDLPADAGSHRHWRVRFRSGPGGPATGVRELRLLEARQP